MPSKLQRRNGFRSTAHRRAAFANEPDLAKGIADKYGAKAGGGYTKNQISQRIKAGIAKAQAAATNPMPPKRASRQRRGKATG